MKLKWCKNCKTEETTSKTANYCKKCRSEISRKNWEGWKQRSSKKRREKNLENEFRDPSKFSIKAIYEKYLPDKFKEITL